MVKFPLTIIFSIFLTVAVQTSFGQVTFNKLIYPGFSFTRFSGVVATDSCYYLKSTFTDSVAPYYLGLMFSKLDLNGELINSTTIYSVGTLYDGVFNNLINTSDGRFIQVASMGDSIARAILIVHNPDLDTVFTRQYYGPLFPELQHMVSRRVLQRPDNGYAVLFGHESIEDIDFDISMLFLDSAFNKEQFKIYASTPLQETATALILDDDGGYIIGGNRENTNQVWENFTYRTLIIKTDANGNQVWQWLSPAGQLWGEAEALVKTPDGGLVVASRKGVEIPINQSDGVILWDAMVFKLDAENNMEWQTPLRGAVPSESTQLAEMVEAMDGSGYVVTGQLADNVSVPELQFGTWLAKVSPSGDSLWARYYSWIDGQLLNPEPWTMTTTPDGGYIVAGITVEQGVPAPGWVLKVDSFGCLVPGCHLPNAITDEGKPTIELSIYPNPTSDFLNFYLRAPSASKVAMFRIVDSNGRLVKEMKTENLNSTYVVPIHDWVNGVYWLQYMDEDRMLHSEKFIKQ